MTTSIVDKIMEETLGALGPFTLGVSPTTGAIGIDLGTCTLYATPEWEESHKAHTLVWELYNIDGQKRASGQTPFNYNMSDSEVVSEWCDVVIEMAYAYS